MKIKSGFVLRRVAGNNVVVPVGAATLNFNGMINLNDSGAFLWDMLQSEADENQLVNALCAEYDTNDETAEKDVREFLFRLKEADLLE